jgi:hypothetical protein
MLVCAFDLATTSGWAVGRVDDDVPSCGSIRFAGKGASKPAIFGNALEWIIGFLKEHKPDVIAIEATLPTTFVRGRTSKNTNDVLVGLVAIFEAVAYARSIYKINEHSVSAVRSHFIDMNACARDEAKMYTIRKCRSLGWLEKADDDAADAAALWSYQCSLFDPRKALRVSPLFQKGVAL